MQLGTWLNQFMGGIDTSYDAVIAVNLNFSWRMSLGGQQV